MINIDLITKIQELLKEKRESIFSVLIVAILGIVIYTLYLDMGQNKEDCKKQIDEIRSIHTEEIKQLRNDLISSQISCNEEIRQCHQIYRDAIDSLDNVYYYKFKNLNNRIKEINESLQ